MNKVVFGYLTSDGKWLYVVLNDGVVKQISLKRLLVVKVFRRLERTGVCCFVEGEEPNESGYKKSIIENI